MMFVLGVHTTLVSEVILLGYDKSTEFQLHFRRKMTKLILLFSPVFSYIEIFTKHPGVLKIVLRIIGRLNSILCFHRLKIDFHAINSTRNKYKKNKRYFNGLLQEKTILFFSFISQRQLINQNMLSELNVNDQFCSNIIFEHVKRWIDTKLYSTLLLQGIFTCKVLAILLHCCETSSISQFKSP